LLKEPHLNTIVILVLLVPSSNFTFALLSEININFNNSNFEAYAGLHPQTSEVGRWLLLVKELFEVASFFKPKLPRESSSLKQA
jgi:hypothetical protein